jgi:hypothetical protein
MRKTDLPWVQKAFRKVQRHGAGALLHLLFMQLVNALVPNPLREGKASYLSAKNYG